MHKMHELCRKRTNYAGFLLRVRPGNADLEACVILRDGNGTGYQARFVQTGAQVKTRMEKSPGG